MEGNLSIFSKIIRSSYKLRSNDDINSGYCYIWAFLVRNSFPEAQICMTPFHAFIKLNDKYYDAEHYKGVKNWKIIGIKYYENVSKYSISRNKNDHKRYFWPL